MTAYVDLPRAMANVIWDNEEAALAYYDARARLVKKFSSNMKETIKPLEINCTWKFASMPYAKLKLWAERTTMEHHEFGYRGHNCSERPIPRVGEEYIRVECWQWKDFQRLLREVQDAYPGNYESVRDEEDEEIFGQIQVTVFSSLHRRWDKIRSLQLESGELPANDGDILVPTTDTFGWLTCILWTEMSMPPVTRPGETTSEPWVLVNGWFSPFHERHFYRNEFRLASPQERVAFLHQMSKARLVDILREDGDSLVKRMFEQFVKYTIAKRV